MSQDYHCYCTQCLRKFYGVESSADLEKVITRRLADSIHEWCATLTPEKAKAFLAQLPMYDENGKLKYDY